jgi:hypothetical protein
MGHHAQNEDYFAALKLCTQRPMKQKGTSAEPMHFYMSRNEFEYMLNPQWPDHVSDALSTTPKTTVFTTAEARRAFRIDLFAWEATTKLTRKRTS